MSNNLRQLMDGFNEIRQVYDQKMTEQTQQMQMQKNQKQMASGRASPTNPAMPVGQQLPPVQQQPQRRGAPVGQMSHPVDVQAGPVQMQPQMQIGKVKVEPAADIPGQQGAPMGQRRGASVGQVSHPVSVESGPVQMDPDNDGDAHVKVPHHIAPEVLAALVKHMADKKKTDGR